MHEDPLLLPPRLCSDVLFDVFQAPRLFSSASPTGSSSSPSEAASPMFRDPVWSEPAAGRISPMTMVAFEVEQNKRALAETADLADCSLFDPLELESAECTPAPSPVTTPHRPEHSQSTTHTHRDFLPPRHLVLSTAASPGSEEDEGRRRRRSSAEFDDDGEPQKRSVLNVLERARREGLKSNFHRLRDEVPVLLGLKRVAKGMILRKATDFILQLDAENKALEASIQSLRQENERLMQHCGHAALS